MGTTIKHKLFGEGTIIEVKDDLTLVRFEKSNEVKKLVISTLLINNLILIEDEELKDNISSYKHLLSKENDIPRSFAQAKEKLEPYKEYLD